MIHKLLKFLVYLSPGIRRTIFRWWYQLISSHYRKKGLMFFNYGYAELNETENRIEIEKHDELNRYPIQLYHHIASNVDLSRKNVLEVGSGPGGGSSYIMRYHKPETMTGIDISSYAVDFCNEVHRSIPNLSFQQGDAEDLPFSDGSFDALINVESSHCYGSMDKFLSEVKRVLRSNGYFLFCDIRDTADMPSLRESLRSCGLKLIREKFITDNVLAALDCLSEQKEKLIRKHAPKWLVKPLSDTTGVKGGKRYEAMRSGKSLYISCILQKNNS